jgi:hypothetical protein
MVKVTPFRRQAGGRRVRRVLASKVDRRLTGDDGSTRGAAAASYNSDEEYEKEKEKGRGFCMCDEGLGVLLASHY